MKKLLKKEKNLINLNYIKNILVLISLIISFSLLYQNCSQFGFEAKAIKNGATLQGYINGPSFFNQQVTFTNEDGYAIFEGDIILGKTKDIIKKKPALSIGGISYSVAFTEWLWENATIPYVLSNNPIINERINIAIKQINEETVLHLIPRTHQKSYVYFKINDSNRSPIGVYGGEQWISLKENAEVATIIHEIFHTAGLWHEQNRRDRNEYIDIIYENIVDNQHVNFLHSFMPRIVDKRDKDLGYYDYNSIMHYDSYAYSKNGQPTILKKDGSLIGPNTRISEGDKVGLEQLYFPNGDNSALNTSLKINRFGFSLNANTQPNNTSFSFDLDNNKEVYISWDVSGAKKITLTFKLLKMCTKDPNATSCNPAAIIVQNENRNCGLSIGKENSWLEYYEQHNFQNKNVYLNFTGSECFQYGRYEVILKAENDNNIKKESIVIDIL